MAQQDVRPGTVQETLLIPLYGRAVESRKEEPALRDPRAEAMVAAIDYDFARFDGLPSLLGTVLRTSLFDRWTADFLAGHPTGTVVEIGTGLNTRFERVDNGRACWIDLDLPDVVDLIAERFPGSLLALDTAGPGVVATQDTHDALSKVAARMQWTCADPADLAGWRPGTRLIATHTLSSLPQAMYEALPVAYQKMLVGLAEQRLPNVEEYRLNLVRLP